MGPQSSPVQSLPSVMGVQLTFKGDCKALSIYSGILLPGRRRARGELCLSPAFPPPATSVAQLLINSSAFPPQGLELRNEPQHPCKALAPTRAPPRWHQHPVWAARCWQPAVPSPGRTSGQERSRQGEPRSAANFPSANSSAGNVLGMRAPN